MSQAYMPTPSPASLNSTPGYRAGAGHKAPPRRGQGPDAWESGSSKGGRPQYGRSQPAPPPPPADPPFRRTAPPGGRAEGKRAAGAPADPAGVRPAATMHVGPARMEPGTAKHLERMLARKNKRAIVLDRQERQRALARKIFEREKQQKQRREEELARQQREEMARIMYERMCAGLRAEEAKRYRAAAKKIQRVYRGYLARDMIARCEAACVTIQALVRSHQSRVRQRQKREQELIDRAQAVQQGRRNRAAIKIQRRARFWFAKRQMARIKRSKQLRRWHCAKRIQTCWRNYRRTVEKEMMLREAEMKKAEEQRQKHLHHAARSIQSVWRGFTTRVRVRALRADMETRHEAATTIQKRVRGMIARKLVFDLKHSRLKRQFTAEQRSAGALRIQRFVRVGLAKAEVARRRATRAREAHVTRLHKAAATVQRSYRCHRARKELRQRKGVRRLQEGKAVVIQSAWRCSVARAELKRRRGARKKEPAARTIQSEWREGADRKERKASQEARQKAKQAEREAEKRTGAAMQIQAWARGNAGRNEAARRREVRRGRVAAAVRIQRCGRMLLENLGLRQTLHIRARVISAERRDTRRDAAARTIQQEVRHFLRRRAVSWRREREGAALKIQCRYREHSARSELDCRRTSRLRRKQAAAAIKIQRMVRRALKKIELQRLEEYYLGVQRRRLLEQRREEAALSIQTMYRGYRDRLRCEVLKKENMRIFGAACIIQRTFRRWLGRLRTTAILQQRAQERKRKLRAVIRIQNFWKRILAQDFVQMLREARAVDNDAATAIQCWWRRLVAVREAQKRRELRRQVARMAEQDAIAAEQGVLSVQAACRAKLSGLHRLRRQAALLRKQLTVARSYADSVRQGAAIKIQARMRGISDRQYARGLRLERREQKRRDVELRRQREKAAITIQCANRQGVARVDVRKRRERRKEEARARQIEYELAEEPQEVVQQLFWELEARSGRLLLSEQNRRNEERRKAALSIQCMTRCRAARDETHSRRQKRRLDLAASVVQRAWRLKSLRLQQQKAVRRQYAAITLQAWARGNAGRDKARALRSAHAERVRRALREEELTDGAVVTIQSFWRGVQGRRHAADVAFRRNLRAAAYKKLEASVIIQKSFRGHRCRTEVRRRAVARSMGT
eukprot:Hpha_TRINITY_DN16687_c2_g9::TRINITY_DN16687_c2_g9_i1::g.182721::m.182721